MVDERISVGFWKKLFGGTEEKEARRFSAPENKALYAVGDIHGRADLLAKLCETIKKDIAALPEGVSAELIFLGDYIDRGFHSREVIDYLLKLSIPNTEIVFLAGNHEDMMLDFMNDPANGQLWLGVGGLAALASYGIYVSEESDLEELVGAASDLQDKLPVGHLQFLKNLREDCSAGDYYFVHAGIRPGVPLDAQRRRDKLGIRREFTLSGVDYGVCVVHGHTGVRSPEVHKNRIAIDTGAFATGVLTAVVLEGEEARFLTT